MDTTTFLLDLKKLLLEDKNWNDIILSRQWTSKVPSTAGVYVLKEENEIVYVGETGNLKGRMNDLLDSRHHTVRRTIGKKFFASHPGFIQATSKLKFPDDIEMLVNDHICRKLKIAYLPVELGRKELEELIEKNINGEIKLNNRGKRGKRK